MYDRNRQGYCEIVYSFSGKASYFLPFCRNFVCHFFVQFTESVTATVELNAIAMKRGELAEYRQIEMPQPHFYPPPSLDFRGMYNQRLGRIFSRITASSAIFLGCFVISKNNLCVSE